MPSLQIFRDSQVSSDCDQCRGRVDLIKGGVCSKCRRILCAQHLHGSFLRRLLVDMGVASICVKCRAAS